MYVIRSKEDDRFLAMDDAYTLQLEEAKAFKTIKEAEYNSCLGEYIQDIRHVKTFWFSEREVSNMYQKGGYMKVINQSGKNVEIKIDKTLEYSYFIIPYKCIAGREVSLVNTGVKFKDFWSNFSPLDHYKNYPGNMSN
jgi:hypothetical protein